jgi:dihydroorotate dehydrogenase
MVFRFGNEILPRSYGYPMKIRMLTRLGLANESHAHQVRKTLRRAREQRRTGPVQESPDARGPRAGIFLDRLIIISKAQYSNQMWS